MNGSVQVFDDVTSLLDALAGQWKKIAAESITDHGAFHVALSGGRTPRSLYAYLAQDDTEAFFSWDKVHVYFGDERCVPQDHSDSNFQMARETLFSKVDIPASQIHPMYSPSLTPEQNAADYAVLLEQCLPKDHNGIPVFDLILLGVGGDGHTASLFPGTEILHENTKTVAAQFVDKFDAWRISLTYPTLNAARHVAVLVVGTDKAEIFSELSKLSDDDIRYPVQGVNPQGDLQWFLDKAASRFVSGDVNP